MKTLPEISKDVEVILSDRFPEYNNDENGRTGDKEWAEEALKAYNNAADIYNRAANKYHHNGRSDEEWMSSLPPEVAQEIREADDNMDIVDIREMLRIISEGWGTPEDE